jgi:CubicO group peptidase (beta-lactamase class C family)
MDINNKAIDTVLSEAVLGKDVPFIVAMVGDRNGVIYSGAAGNAAEDRIAEEDTVFRIFSMTKAVGALAAMILIERDKLDFDTEVAEILPEFANLQVLDGFDGDKPILRPAKTKASIRQLATHTSGLEYEFWNADVARYMELTEHPTIFTGTKASLRYPLMSDPGTRWGYGPGMDWLGQIVEKIDGRRIDQFCQEEIFDPLDMNSTAFEMNDTLALRLASGSVRDENGELTPTDFSPQPDPEVYCMGHALYSTATDYLRFLRMFLNGGELNGRRLLSTASIERMLADQMNGLTFQKMISVAPAATNDCDPFPNIRRTHSFGFFRTEEIVPGMRAAGSQSWAGVLNTHFWLDPKNDIASVIMTQCLPFLDTRFLKVFDAYERAVYKS